MPLITLEAWNKKTKKCAVPDDIGTANLIKFGKTLILANKKYDALIAKADKATKAGDSVNRKKAANAAIREANSFKDDFEAFAKVVSKTPYDKKRDGKDYDRGAFVEFLNKEFKQLQGIEERVLTNYLPEKMVSKKVKAVRVKFSKLNLATITQEELSSFHDQNFRTLGAYIASLAKKVPVFAPIYDQYKPYASAALKAAQSHPDKEALISAMRSGIGVMQQLED